MAKKAVSKKAVSKKTAAGRKPASAKSAAEGRLVATAKVVGRTLGRAAKGIDRASSVVKKKAAAFKRGTSTGKRKKDPVVEEKRARTRAHWKAQEKASSAVEMAQTNTLVDERARVRATTGMSWSNRKPR
jgi:hypothetical protein